MGVEARKDTKERKRKEEEDQRMMRKRKFETWRWPRGEYELDSSMDSTMTDTCLVNNLLGVGHTEFRGLTVEGEGERGVPVQDSIIYEQSQASNVSTLYLDGTGGPEQMPENVSSVAEKEWITSE